jgi:phosphatidate cytidylyltransferase
MLFERMAVALLLIPFGFWVIGAGGWFFTGTIALILAMAAYEYATLFRNEGFRPATWILVIGTLALVLLRYVVGFDVDGPLLAGLILASMAWHAIDYERGAPQSGTDFALSLGGLFYVGWMGSFLISIRELPDGLWWFMTALPAIWLADSGAYFIGKWIGRHRLAPRLSPKKTWEGYIAGIILGPIIMLGFIRIWQFGAGANSSLSLSTGVIVALLISIVAPMGDLGISMLKRQFGVKDTGALLPGHGGALDRIDSWVWAAVIGYFMVIWLT